MPKVLRAIRSTSPSFKRNHSLRMSSSIVERAAFLNVCKALPANSINQLVGKNHQEKKKAIKCHVSNISMQMGIPHTIYSQGIFTVLIRGTVLLWINPLKLSFKNPIRFKKKRKKKFLSDCHRETKQEKKRKQRVVDHRWWALE